jgi:tripartite-type tricarboxylate transporter receptor subunit TctC
MSRIAQSSKAVVFIVSLGAVIAAPTVGSAQSTDYPNQRISFIVEFAVGGFADTIGR